MNMNVFLSAFCGWLLPTLLAAQATAVDFVNTMVGTAACDAPPTSIFGRGTEVLGQTLPAVLLPNGQTFWTPQTRTSERKCVAPYYHDDQEFMGVRASHWIVGGCTQDYGSATIAVTMDAESASLPYGQRQEISTPYYYKLTLPGGQPTTELTGHAHSAMLRYVFHSNGTACLHVTVNSDTREGSIRYDAARRRVCAENPVHRLYQGRGQRAGFSGWLALQLPHGVGLRPLPEPETADGQPQRLRLVFSVNAGDTLLLRAATSLRSGDGAWRNLNHELPTWNFEQACQWLKERWNERLGAVEVESQDTLALRKFYTALYHSSFLPRLMSDCDEPQDYYTDFSMWDTYRALHPLLVLLWPKLDGDMMQSLVEFGKRGGWLPIFPCWDSYTAAMIGDHCTAALCDAWVKRVWNFDIKSAYRLMRQNAFRSPRTEAEYKDGKGRRALKSYLQYGFIPLEDEVPDAYHTREQTSRTLEYAYDDWCLSQVAWQLHKRRDAAKLIQRADNWRNVLNPQTGYTSGRHADGRFDTSNPFELQPFITEGSPCHYTFYVPHDIPGLMQAMGGKEQFVAKLDTLFFGFGEGKKLPSLGGGGGGLYWHGNEPCHQIPYLYAMAGELQKTQAVVARIMQQEYRDTPGGLSGNDDAGQMSAWYVFSALGFYPVCPGSPDYVLGLPAFDKVIVHLSPTHTFTILRDAPDGTPCTVVYLNGQRLDTPVISHQQILQGGTLRFAAQ